MKEAIVAAANDGAHGVIEALRAGVFGHAEKLFLEDDITLLVAEKV